MGVFVLVGTRKGLFLLESDEGRDRLGALRPLPHGVVDLPRRRRPARRDDLRGDEQRRLRSDRPPLARPRRELDARRRSWASPRTPGLTLEKTWHVEPGGPARTVGSGWAPRRGFSSARTTEATAGRRWTGSSVTRPAIGGTRAPEGCAATRSRWIPTSRSACTSASRRRGSSAREDGGETLDAGEPRNRGRLPPRSVPRAGPVRAQGARPPERPERLWQQNHCGVYRSDDRGDSWERLEGNGLPSGFGFPLALDHRRSGRSVRHPRGERREPRDLNGRLGVYRTRRQGRVLGAPGEGLPQRAWGAVMREGFSSDRLDPPGIYLGTQSGSLFVSPDAGETWHEAVAQLPPILSVEAAEWP